MENLLRELIEQIKGLLEESNPPLDEILEIANCALEDVDAED